jgi:hypothetical protein
MMVCVGGSIVIDFKRDACRNDTTIRMHIYVES